jgi:psiF repeat
MVRSVIVIVATLTLLLGIEPVLQSQAQDDGGTTMPSHSKAAPTKGRWSDLLAKWRQNKPKLKACRAEARKKGLAGDDRWFFLESCLGRS